MAAVNLTPVDRGGWQNIAISPTTPAILSYCKRLIATVDQIIRVQLASELVRGTTRSAELVTHFKSPGQ